MQLHSGEVFKHATNGWLETAWLAMLHLAVLPASLAVWASVRGVSWRRGRSFSFVQQARTSNV